VTVIFVKTGPITVTVDLNFRAAPMSSLNLWKTLQLCLYYIPYDTEKTVVRFLWKTYLHVLHTLVATVKTKMAEVRFSLANTDVAPYSSMKYL
jgi:hypothetical protein